MNSETLENTRRIANEAMERASSRVKDLRTGVSDMASRSMSSLSDRAAAAKGYVGDYATASTRYVSEHPLKSALIAAAIGAAVAGLVIALRHRRDNEKYF
jgi:ElaB/YqjD/DUF883 family membrane-anchored ribosome-binding protein